MKQCPRCGLLLEALQWGDWQIEPCRGCGGLWLPSARALEESAGDRNSLQELLKPYPNLSVEEAHEGLPRRCPQCRTAYLQQRADGPGSRCPSCGGVWLNVSEVRALLSQPSHQSPSARQTTFPTGLPREPAQGTIVLTCMDARLPVLEMLGLRLGDAHVLRNAGALLTEDALRSVLISHYLMGTNRLLIVGHTDCGMTRFTDDNLLARIKAETGVEKAVPNTFLAFGDVERSVRRQVVRGRRHPWLANRVAVEGLIYDVDTGEVRPVAP